MSPLAGIAYALFGKLIDSGLSEEKDSLLAENAKLKNRMSVLEGKIEKAKKIHAKNQEAVVSILKKYSDLENENRILKNKVEFYVEPLDENPY